jgi:hypothetical protein
MVCQVCQGLFQIPNAFLRPHSENKMAVDRPVRPHSEKLSFLFFEFTSFRSCLDLYGKNVYELFSSETRKIFAAIMEYL